jgi:hypothetical protein
LTLFATSVNAGYPTDLTMDHDSSRPSGFGQFTLGIEYDFSLPNGSGHATVGFDFDAYLARTAIVGEVDGSDEDGSGSNKDRFKADLNAELAEKCHGFICTMGCHEQHYSTGYD